jgi:hypothetical protein
MAEKKKLTPAERKKVEDQIKELQDSLEEREEATPEDQAAADAEVERQRQATAELFDRLGITEEDWTVLSAAFAAGTEDRTRRIVREELAAEATYRPQTRPSRTVRRRPANTGRRRRSSARRTTRRRGPSEPLPGRH